MKEHRYQIGIVLLVLYYLIIVAVVAWLLADRPPLAMLWWKRVADASQAMAYRLGRVGLEAERAYYVAVERTRL